MTTPKEQWIEALWAAMRDLSLRGEGTVKAMNIHTVRLFCDEAEKKLGEAGLVILPASFLINFREFVSDWKKGDFDLPKLAQLDVQACLTALDCDGVEATSFVGSHIDTVELPQPQQGATRQAKVTRHAAGVEGSKP